MRLFQAFLPSLNLDVVLDLCEYFKQDYYELLAIWKPVHVEELPVWKRMSLFWKNGCELYSGIGTKCEIPWGRVYSWVVVWCVHTTSPGPFTSFCVSFPIQPMFLSHWPSILCLHSYYDEKLQESKTSNSFLCFRARSSSNSSNVWEAWPSLQPRTESPPFSITLARVPREGWSSGTLQHTDDDVCNDIVLWEARWLWRNKCRHVQCHKERKQSLNWWSCALTPFCAVTSPLCDLSHAHLSWYCVAVGPSSEERATAPA